MATVMWVLFALRKFAQSDRGGWPKGWRARRLTPGAVRRVALGLLVKLGIQPPSPKCAESRQGGRSEPNCSLASAIGSSASGGGALLPRADRLLAALLGW